MLRQLLNMNPPEHGEYRRVVNQRFTPRSVKQLTEQIERITTETLDGLVGREECDFVTEVSAKLPLAVIAEMFGIPRADWAMMFRLSNAMIGPADPEYGGSASIKENLERARMEFFQYFSQLCDDRRRNPRDDLASALANGKVNGEPLPPFELLSYFALLIIAGNETTRNATTGGLHALISHPDQWERLKRDSSLGLKAAEEIVRWTSPVIQFTRIATADTVLHGQQLHEGDVLALFYPSAARDEDVFERPSAFDIGRYPNPHISFGIGEHFCLGANLARLELQVMFRQLAERMEFVELAGPTQRMRSSSSAGSSTCRFATGFARDERDSDYSVAQVSMISAKDLQESVAAMLAARSDRRALKRLPPSGAALSLEDAYSIQETFVRKHGLPVGLHFVREPPAVIADFGAMGGVQVQVRS